MRVTTDGGKTWSDISPPITNARFVNPFEMDPLDSLHLATGGNEIVETVVGAETGSFLGTGLFSDWTQVFDLGTRSRPGDPAAEPDPLNPSLDPANGMSAVDVHGDAIYVGFCAPCDILNARVPFERGLATNIGGNAPPQRGTSDGWHIAAARGLPKRFITSIAIDPRDARTIVVTLGGYSRRWVPPGTLHDEATLATIGEGHVFKSTDGGETFVDISGDLPDVPATWVTLRGNQIIVATDIGVFASSTNGGTSYAPLVGLPVVPISTMNLKPDNPNMLVAATYGRGIWIYRFSKALGGTKDSPDIPPPATVPDGIGSTVVAGPFGFEGGAGQWSIETTDSGHHVETGRPRLQWVARQHAGDSVR
jgi:hypothetical protein